MTSYASRQNLLAVGWKQRTSTLLEEARLPDAYRDHSTPYDFCLPREHASANLLPDVRDGAISLFQELGIPWHDGIDGGPSNHLRDSQVQCVNALYRMVDDPERIQRAFGGVLDIAEVLPIERNRFLTFEYVDASDFLGEGNGQPLVRGTKCTSVDAAFRFRTSAGATELALVEWKYTEAYLRPQERGGRSDDTRTRRYAAHYAAPDGPLRGDKLPFTLMLDEPFYQLMRQQLLAHRLEHVHAEEAEIVRVLHVLSPHNVDYQRSLPRAEHRALGDSVDEVWSRLLRDPSRFIHVDPGVFLNAAVTSPEYVDRYSDAAPGADEQ